jgi:hypothetical protein
MDAGKSPRAAPHPGLPARIGTIGVTDNPGGGTRFTFTIPCAPAADRPAGGAAGRPTAAGAAFDTRHR